MPTHHEFDVLFVPVDGEVRSLKITDIAEIDGLVGGKGERTQYDRDSLVFVNDVGRLLHLPMNRRVTDYIKSGSDAAHMGRMQGADPSYGLYGPCVVIGTDERDNLTNVPERLVNLFAGELLKEPQQQFVIGFTTGPDQRVERLYGPQSYDEAMNDLRSHLDKVSAAETSLSADADDAVTRLSSLDEGEEFEAEVGDRTYFVVSEELDEHTGIQYELG